jgi:hypothetical protein
MLQRPGYLDEFLAFWSARDEVEKIWFSLFTPQRGAETAERLSAQQRRQVVSELMELRNKYAKADMPQPLLEQFLRPPASPEDCIFAQTTETVSADLRTRITPCQFGGDPDCSQCGCFASMGLAAIGDHRLGGLIPVGSLFRGSIKIGRAIARRSAARSLPETSASAPAHTAGRLVTLQTGAEESTETEIPAR